MYLADNDILLQPELPSFGQRPTNHRSGKLHFFQEMHCSVPLKLLKRYVKLCVKNLPFPGEE